jgi:hypothetical protein
LRSFGIIAPQFWTGRTGREIQAAGPDAVIIATYLMTSPHSHMCGLYYVSKQYIVYDTGRPMKSVEKALQQLATLPSGAFAVYDEASQHVWLPEMMRWQLGGPLKPNDGRIIAIIKWYQALPRVPFLKSFFNRYRSELPGLELREYLDPEKGRDKGGDSPPPIYTPDPDLVPVSPEGVQGKPKSPFVPELKKAYGEKGNVRLTDEEHAKLKIKLNGNLDDFIAQLDAYPGVNPKRFRQYICHYDVITTWFNMALKDGKIKPRASPAVAIKPTDAEMDAHALRVFGKVRRDGQK